MLGSDFFFQFSFRYLRQRLQARLAAIQLSQGKYDESIRGIEILMREVKQLDDKQLLVELHLVESQIHHKVCVYVDNLLYLLTV